MQCVPLYVWLSVKCCSRCSLINCNTRRSLAERAQTHAERWYLPPCPPFTPFYKKLPVLTLIFFQSWYTSLSYWFTRDSKRRRATSCLHKDITFYQTQVQSLPCLVNPWLNQSLLFFFFSWLYDLAMGTTIMWLALIDVFKYDDVYSINLRVCTVSTFIEFQGKTVR